MTIEEMKNLKLGDIVKDFEVSSRFKKEIFCVIVRVDSDMVCATALNKEDEHKYPHNFRFNDDDCLKLSLPIKNINDELYKKIFNNFRSLESFSKKVYK